MKSHRIIVLGVVFCCIFLFFDSALYAQNSNKAYTPVEQFLIDKETDVVAIVTVQDIETRWIILEDGDHVPIHFLDCRMDESLQGRKDWLVGENRTVAQFDYTEIIMAPISPPALVGRRYLLWASLNDPKDGEMAQLGNNWIAHIQGLHLVRGVDKASYFYWNGKNYSVTEVRQYIKDDKRIPLNRIVDPMKRLEIAKTRITKNKVGDPKVFAEGLILGIRDPVGQASCIEKVQQAEPNNTIMSMFSNDRKSPFEIWYESLAVLIDLGAMPAYRSVVVSALKPFVADSRERIQLSVALVLAQLGDDSGQKIIEKALNAEKIELCKDPDEGLILRGRLKYDDSSIIAAGYALGLLGNRNGLKHQSMEVRLASAEGLASHPDHILRNELKAMTLELDKEVEKLASAGKLTEKRRKGDFTLRYPKEWIKAHHLLSRLGEEDSLKHLLDAYKTDLSTYPIEEEMPFPVQRAMQWTSLSSGWLSLSAAIISADANKERLLGRLRILLEQDPIWVHPQFLPIRVSLGDPSLNQNSLASSQKENRIKKKVSEMLASQDPKVRAQGLAGAGFNQMDEYFHIVLEKALHGKDIEKNAALYGLGFYRKAIPEEALRLLASEGESETRLTGLEIATRHKPAPFAGEAMQLLQDIVTKKNPSKDAAKDDFNNSRLLTHLIRVLSRFSRSTVPQVIFDGLKSSHPEIRIYVAQALGMGGNPAVVNQLIPLKNDPDRKVRAAVTRALDLLGPAE